MGPASQQGTDQKGSTTLKRFESKILVVLVLCHGAKNPQQTSHMKEDKRSGWE